MPAYWMSSHACEVALRHVPGHHGAGPTGAASVKVALLEVDAAVPSGQPASLASPRYLLMMSSFVIDLDGAIMVTDLCLRACSSTMSATRGNRVRGR
jgi:hypothetical protein